MSEKLIPKNEKNPKTIKTKAELSYWIEDARNQFDPTMIIYLIDNGYSDQIKNLFEKNKLLNLSDYLKTKSIILGPQILEDEECKADIIIYDDLIEKIKNFEDVDKLKVYIKEFTDYFSKK